MSKKVEPFFNHGHVIKDPNTDKLYKIHSMIGSGAFAQCFLVLTDTKEYFAMKIIDYSKIKSKTLASKLESEIRIHYQLDHPNIVKLYNHFRDEVYVYLLMEFCQNKSLDIYFSKRKNAIIEETGKSSSEITEIFNEEEVRRIMKQLLDVLIYLHEEKHVVHRDLKLGNLFLDHDFNIKVGDFGLSSTIIGNQKRRTFCGTPNYLAPEIISEEKEGHSFEVDIWAFGIIMYTLLVGNPPFQKNKIKDIYETIKKIDYSFPKHYAYSRYSRDLIKAILNRDPNARPSLYCIKEHNFFVRKENTVERIIRNISENTYTQVCDLNRFEFDYVLFSLPICRMKGIGYLFSSGVSGIYFQDCTNIVKYNNKFLYLYRAEDQGKLIIKKEELIDLNDKEESVKKKYEFLIYFMKNYCRKENKRNVESTHVLRVRRVRDVTIFGLSNGCIQFDFIDDKRVVMADDGKNVLCFDSKGFITLTNSLKERVLELLQAVR